MAAKKATTRRPAKAKAKAHGRAKATPKANKTSKKVRNTKAGSRGESPAPSRARGGLRGPYPKGTPSSRKPGGAPPPQKPAKKSAKKRATTNPAAAAPPPRRGRPKNTPDVWTPEHINEVAQQLWDYIEATACPTEAEFCILHLVAHQRLGEIPELRMLKDFMFAKRQAFTVGRGLRLGHGDGPLGSFLAKLAANAGPFSLVDKSERTIKDPAGGAFSHLSDDELKELIDDEITRRSRNG